jgi:PTS system nitrogen regulatory IIA component
VIHSNAQTWGALVDELLASAAREGLHNGAKIRKAVEERESLQHTILPSGLAIPHARMEGFNDLFIAVGIPAKAIEGGAYPISMMALFLTSPEGSGLYLNTLAGFTKLSNDKPLFDKLCKAGSGQEFVRLVSDSRIEVSSVVTVSSIMNPDAKTVQPDDTLKSAIETMYSCKTGYLPVVDAAGDLKGRISLIDLFRHCIPNYALEMANIGFDRELNPVKELITQQNSLLVKDIMQPLDAKLPGDATVMEAMVMMVKKHRHHISIVEGNKLIGVLAYTDILQKVLQE